MNDFSIYKMENKINDYQKKLLLLIHQSYKKNETLNIIRETNEYEAAQYLVELGLLTEKGDDFALTKNGKSMVKFYNNYEFYQDENIL